MQKSNKINGKEEYNKLIDINSPLFELILATNQFNKYTVSISQENIDAKLKEDIILFNKLNKPNINYTSIYYSFSDIKKLKYNLNPKDQLIFEEYKQIIFKD